ncbi:MAG TPA: ferric reductase-like transmembrane domain-containing protein, partial [Candidatus Baltobacteraceae bacterium]|nr:ferric reductase-like transmembrane domain-containing protein [Candidatus Baltobacteraceae bacterium]
MSDRAKKTLLIGLLAANILAAIMFWWRGSSLLLQDRSLDGSLIAFGRLMGLCLQMTLLVQLILISRLPLIEKPFGFDKLNRAHRIVGYTLLGSVLLHPTLLITGYAMASKVSLWAQVVEFWTTWPYVWMAEIGLGILLTIGVISLPWIRRLLKYGTWHGLHLMMYVAVGLIHWHQFNSEDLSAGAGNVWWRALNYSVYAILVGYRFGRPIYLDWVHRFRIERVVPETADVTSVYITGRAMERFTFDPGQYIHVSFMKKGLREPHPFSLSKAPDGKNIRLSIKNSGDFTSRIRELATPGTRLILEGPFGRFTERAAVKAKFLFVAGGIGITPIRSMVERLAARNADAVLLYGNRSSKDVVFRQELQGLGVRVHEVLSEGSEPGFEHGFIDEEKVRRLVPDYLERDVYMCGPPVMTQKLIE